MIQEGKSVYLSNTRVSMSDLHNNRKGWHAYLM